MSHLFASTVTWDFGLHCRKRVKRLSHVSFHVPPSHLSTDQITSICQLFLVTAYQPLLPGHKKWVKCVHLQPGWSLEQPRPRWLEPLLPPYSSSGPLSPGYINLFNIKIYWPGSTSIGNYHSLIKILLETPQEIFSPQQSDRAASDLAVEILTLSMRVLSKQTNHI